MTLIIDQPAVLRADWLDGAAEASGRELEEGCDVRVRLVEGRCGGGLEGLVRRRLPPAPVVSPAEGGSR
jgi:hypothetical protein